MREAVTERPPAQEEQYAAHGSQAPAAVKRSRIVNMINRIHFQGGEIRLLCRDAGAGTLRSLAARPEPCLGRQVACRFPAGEAGPPGGAAIEGFTVEDGLRRVLVEGAPLEVRPGFARFALPEESRDISLRRVRRHPCRDARATLLQGADGLTGEVVSFSAFSFSVRFPHSRPLGLDPRLPVEVTIRRGGRSVFEGPCRLTRSEARGGERTFVLTPALPDGGRGDGPRVSERQHPSPAPLVVLRHPLTDRLLSLRAEDVSGSGFSVEEDPGSAMLLPGLILPEVRLEFLAGSPLTCRARVLHAELSPDGALRSGIGILDMPPEDHARLCSVVLGCRDRHATISSTSIDLEELWDFFFETGFLYPEKYAFLQDGKEEFKRLYERLYLSPTPISRHILYQERGRILGHVSLFRWYRSAWVVHHHAAVKSLRHKAGLAVLEHILHHLDELRRLPSARMGCCAFYFRPENRFANRVFCGVADTIGDPRVASVDALGYGHHTAGAGELPRGWTLVPAADRDLEAFAAYYRRVSGGLMLDGLDLLPGPQDDTEIDAAYAAMGLVRKRLLFALREHDATAAVFVAAISDFGLNLSDLTNSITCLSLRPRPLPPEAARGALDRLAGWYRRGPVPVLVYPRGHAEPSGIPAEKTYILAMVDPRRMGRVIEVMRGVSAARARRVRSDG